MPRAKDMRNVLGAGRKMAPTFNKSIALDAPEYSSNLDAGQCDGFDSLSGASKTID